MRKPIENYIKDVLGITLNLNPYRATNGLPRIIGDTYHLSIAEFDARKILFMCQKAGNEFSPLAICKHTQIVQTKHPNMWVVYAVDEMLAYQRQRLIGYKIPFIVPQKQLYLPFMGAVLTEQSNRKVKNYAKLGRVAQEIILAVLNHRLVLPLTIANVAEYFSISLMTGTVAFDELENFDLAKRISSGRGKMLVFNDRGFALWREALPLLENPVRQIIGVEAIPKHTKFTVAGETLLSKSSMLNEPPQREYAMAIKEYRKLPPLTMVPKIAAPIIIQLWHYSPTFPHEKTMDVLKLFLSFKNETDERIQIELEKLIKDFKW